MKKERIDDFEIRISRSNRFKLDYAVVCPKRFSDEDGVEIDGLARTFINVHLAIVPNVPVLLFQIDPDAEVGSPIYNLNTEGSQVHHIPPRCYAYLDEIAVEAPYIVSLSVVSRILERNRANKSIFDGWEEERSEHGLFLLGVHYAIQEAEV